MAYSMNPDLVIHHALIDAIEHIEALIEGYSISGDFSEHLRWNLDKLEDYRKMMKARYGDDRTPMERYAEGLKSVSLSELLERNKNDS